MSETSEPQATPTDATPPTPAAAPAKEKTKPTAATPPASAAAASKPKEPATETKEVAVKTEPKYGWWWGTGRRKTAVARVRIRPGGGKFVVNKRSFETYFTEDRDRKDLTGVLSNTRTTGNIDVYVNVCGGGYTGQAGAIIQGLGRALLCYDPSLEPILRDHDYLTRDPRKVERKKYGQPGARKRFQFSKR